jgi:hypothetical protein
MLLPRLLQFLAALLLLRLLVRFVAAFVRGLTSPGPARTARAPQPSEATDLVRDRICNTFLARASALTAVIGGREEHFCSIACRDKAQALLKAS